MLTIGLRNHLFTLCILFTSCPLLHAQKWIATDESTIDKRSIQRNINPNKYELYTLDVSNLSLILEDATKRSANNSEKEGILISLPVQKNKLEEFRLLRSDVFHPDLSAKYPQIKSYTGISKSNPRNMLKLSISHKGIHGMILSDEYGTVFIDKYAKDIEDLYIIYNKNDFHKHLQNGEGLCTVEEPHDGYAEPKTQQRFGDCQLRKYRLALACTGEYATFHGGNIPDVLSAYNASLNRINGIYEREFSITMELIPNTDTLIYLDASTDPYTNNDGFTMLPENQANIDAVIGIENYDIGHVYSTGGGGVASLRSPCTNRRARGVTGLGSPDNDPFWVDYVAHEMGHQFGATHTFNNSCNNNITTSTAYEPGSGSTIMAYAGICTPNVQNNSDDYFHAASINQIANFVVAGSGASCAELININNTNPEINSVSGNNHILPISTPFVLTAYTQDAEEDNLTYCWEQMDNEMVEMPPTEDAPGGPSFRSYNPTSSPSRYFPRLSSILFGNNSNTWEVLPNTNREMTFNVTVRDNNLLGGCTADEEVTISFASQAGPFSVTSQSSSTTWNAGTNETITWDVANTDQAPVSCSNVDIYLSLDAGETFDIPLALNTENDGEHEIEVPFEFSSRCRLMIKCSSSIFLDVNSAEFSISAPFSASVSPSTIEVCPNQEATFLIDYNKISNDDVNVSFDLQGLPASATFEFTPSTASADLVSTLVISNLEDVDPGQYILAVVISSDDLTLTEEVQLNLSTLQVPSVEQLYPNDGELNVSSSPFLTWNPLSGVSSYTIELSLTPLFATIEYTSITENTILSLPSLEEQTVYYWRVKGNSICGESSFTTSQSFQTGLNNCNTNQIETNLPISDSGTDQVESTITIESQNIVSGVEVSMIINHEYVGDLSVALRSPNGTTIQLFERPGLSSSAYGCDENNISVSFSNNAANSYADFETTCNSGSTYAIEGEYQPLDNLAILNGQLINGDWTLIVNDDFSDDGGEFIEWSLTTCFTDQIPPAELINNTPLEINNQLEKNITSENLSISSINEENTLFTLKSAPSKGRLFKLNSMTNIYEEVVSGGTFTQNDITTNKIKYQVEIIESGQDLFLFDCIDDQNRYLPNNTFFINSTFDPLSVEIIISEPILCNGDALGELTTVVSGGIAPFKYSLNGNEFSDSNIFSGLPSGTYLITVSDSLQNEVTSLEILLTQPDPIMAQLDFGPNEVTIIASGGTGVKEYSLDGNFYSSINILTLSDNTTYQIYVRDENQCVLELDPFTYYFISDVGIDIVNVACKGEETGSVVVNSVTGGLPPYMYKLDNFDSENGEFLNLNFGEYALLIEDQLDNQFTKTIQILEPEEELSMTSLVNENSITLIANGGTLPYQYSLDGITYSDNPEFTNLFDGEYIGYIQDANGCIVSEESIIVNTSISTLPLGELLLSPNPASDLITITYPSNLKIRYKITDTSGKIIMNELTTSNSTVNIQNLIPGIYFCKLSIEENTKVIKLVIAR